MSRISISASWLIRNLDISTFLLRTAICRAVWPSLLRALMLAPPANSSLSIGIEPCSAARCNGVQYPISTLSCKSGSPPYSNSILTYSTFLHKTDRCKAVTPLISQSLISTSPAFRRASASSVLLYFKL